VRALCFRHLYATTGKTHEPGSVAPNQVQRAGGGAREDHGGPGERPQYHAGYYGAYLRDPD
jgi:hypothetical protein